MENRNSIGDQCTFASGEQVENLLRRLHLVLGQIRDEHTPLPTSPAVASIKHVANSGHLDIYAHLQIGAFTRIQQIGDDFLQTSATASSAGFIVESNIVNLDEAQRKRKVTLASLQVHVSQL